MVCVMERLTVLAPHLMVWLKDALRIWLLSLEKLRQVTPLLWACSNLRRHKPLCIVHTWQRAHKFVWFFFFKLWDIESQPQLHKLYQWQEEWSNITPLFCHSELQLPAALHPDWSTCTAQHRPSSWSCPGPDTLNPNDSEAGVINDLHRKTLII